MADGLPSDRPAARGRFLPLPAAVPGSRSSRIAAFQRTLDQQLVALLRGVSLECPVCGEFVMHAAAAIVCPECGLELRDEHASTVGLPAGVLRLHAG